MKLRLFSGYILFNPLFEHMKVVIHSRNCVTYFDIKIFNFVLII